MLDADVRRVLDGTSLAHLATVLPDGAPHSVPVWVGTHGEHIVILTGPGSRKARNLCRDPRVALLFLIPGSGSTLRVNGCAQVSADPRLLASFEMEGRAPRTVIVMTVDEIYFQCARAIVRSDLWNPDKRVDPKTLPTPGQILAEMSENRVGGEQYDREWPERARQSMW